MTGTVSGDHKLTGKPYWRVANHLLAKAIARDFGNSARELVQARGVCKSAETGTLCAPVCLDS